MENLDRELIKEIQIKMLKQLHKTLSTEELFFLSFHLDDGSRYGIDIKTTNSEYRKVKDS